MSLSNKTILPGSTIGIIGGGQLGRMMTVAAKSMGYDVAVLEPTPNSPCGQLADYEITAPYNDLDAIKRLAEISNVITYEFENIDYEALKWIEENACLPQGSALLSMTQDRETEKKAIVEAGCKVADYRIVKTETELAASIDELDYPCVLKTCRGGYDGKGQAVIKQKSDFQAAADLLKSGICILEKWVAFEKEVSVIVARNSDGEIFTFPIAENIHVNNILHQSIVPARIKEEVSAEARKQAILLAKAFNLVGTLAVEMFVAEDGGVFINELAPRPHNSGHYTIDLCETDQFEQHIRAVCNLPLGNPKLLHPGLMVNVLGEHLPLILNNLSLFREGKIYLYGKKEAKHKRKMGHVTFLTEGIEEKEKEINKLWGQQ
ncbi:5-(carboxyamino)imidazole ribonucleotide synthase [Metabacillus idriensis]|uniref:5-(carboxyamino)imidazole ribonucleotide synthase n=1 Tax=Metabacillus idriensis TaxID=324768 RepID=UPI001748BA8F|nr:5-(carboxyamino)imidazole ribonucleotide synthase [Metabacillus idriensis]